MIAAAKTGHMADCIAQMLPVAACTTRRRAEIMALVQDMAATLGPDQFQRQLRMMQRRLDQRNLACANAASPS